MLLLQKKQKKDASKYNNSWLYNALVDAGYSTEDIIDIIDNRFYHIYNNCDNMLDVTKQYLEYNNNTVDNLYDYMDYLLNNCNYEFIFCNGNCIQLFY